MSQSTASAGNIATQSTETSRRGPDKPVVHRVTLHGVTAEVIAPRSLNRTIAIVLGGYPVAERGITPHIRVVVERAQSGRSDWLISDGTHTYPELDKNGMPAIRAEWLVISQAIKHWSNFIHVHAGLVATPDVSALLIGKSGSGKSTTTVALALNGLDVYTDDVALIDRASLRALCVPRPIKLDRRSRAMLRKRGLVVTPRRRLNESIDRTTMPGLPSIEDPGPPLGSVLFFAAARADKASIRPLSAAEAMLRLVQQSASERLDLMGPSPGALTIVNTVPCYELISGDLASTIELIQCHLRQASPVTQAEMALDSVNGEATSRP